MKMDFVLERLYTLDKIVLDKRGQSYTCGRGKENEIVCLSLLVSRRHCIFFHDTEKLYVTDLQSSNGIFINGKIQRTYQMIELHENDIIGIGCSDVNPADEPALYVYKVYGVKTSFAAEEVNSSLLSRTILNRDALQQKSASYEKGASEEECGYTTDSDMVVPCNISRGTNSKAHISNASPSGEINSHISDGNQSSRGNNTDNFVEIKSDTINMEMEDDIEIIHMSYKEETKNGDAEQYNLRYDESLTNNNKSYFSGKEFQHSKESRIEVRETAKKMGTAIDGNGKGDTNDNNKDARKRYIAKTVPGDLGKTAGRTNPTKESNFIYSNDQIIKLEDELQITDDEEEAHASSKMACDTSPIKLKKIKQEPTTRFSEIDVVDLSDNEDGIFPYSQLFDIKFEDDAQCKMEIKQECVNDDTEKVGLLDADDEVIILTDSEDEDNPWLHRLSRSQLVNEDKKPKMSDVIIKDEIDLGIWEDDDISNIIKSGVPCTSKDAKNTIDTRPISIDATAASVHKETSVELCTSVNNKMESKDDSSANSLTTKVDTIHVDDIASSNETDSRGDDRTNKRETHVKEDTEVDRQSKAPNDVPSRISVKERAIKSATTNKRLIPLVEPHVLPKRKRSNKDPDKGRNKEHGKDSSTDINKTSKSSEEKKSSSKLTAEENRMLKLKEKLDNHFYSKEQKRCKESPKKTADCSSSSKTVPTTSISKENKMMIAEKRKARLKKIAEEEKERLSVDVDKTIKRGTAKPRAKVSLKNRGDFLINEQETHVSKRLPDTVAEQAQSGSSRSTIQPTGKTNKSKESVASNVEAKKLHKRQTDDQDSINNVAASLQQSLHLDNVLNTAKIRKKNNNTKDLDATDDIEKECSVSKKRRQSNEKAIEVNETAYELQETIGECTPAPKQKNDSSSNGTKSNLVAKLKKGKVTFSEKVDIKEYEIDVHNSLKRLEGKDAPIPTNKLKINRVKWKPKLEEFLLCIFMWNPVWLEEQRYLKTEPPIVKEDELQPMKLRYDTFQQYYKVAQPLLLHEIWHIITKDFEMVENNMQRATAMCYIVANSITRVPIPSTDSFVTTLMIEVLVRKQDFVKQTHPNYGDLVSFECARDRNVRGKQNFQKLFAYITEMHQTVITDFTHYNKDLRNYVKDPHAVITYTMMTRPLDNDIIFNRVQRVRTVTYLRASMRMVQALQYLPQSPLSQLILNPRIEDYRLPPMDISHTCSSLVTKDQLNPKQLEAVVRVTQAVLKKESKLCFIQGPPGTGKSKVIVNLVTQILYTDNDLKDTEKFRILICAPSNAAIDEIVTRLLVIRSSLKTKRFNMVRIGRHETMHPSAKNISVTELAKRYIKQIADKGVRLSYENPANLREEKAQLEAEINSLQSKLAKAINMPDTNIKTIKRKLIDASTKYQLVIGGKSIDQINVQDRARYQRSAEDTILAGADVIACTLSSCYTKQMESIFGVNKQSLSVCIVDEATQSCEAETLIPLMLGVNTLVLVGDPNQLPATILSQRAKKLGLDQSVFSRMQCAFASQANNPIIMLDTQYRMAYSISYWPNRYFYAGKLKNSAENRQTFPFHPYRVLNHSSAQNDNKFTNTTEAEFVANIIFAMLMFAKWENTKEPISLGVLTPYNNQRIIVLTKIQERISTVPDNIRKRISFEVNTVDSFQGQERDVIIMSCVRSQGIGFLSDKQRLCVALTRAKHSLILCGNFNTFMKDQMWKALLSDARSRGVLCNINANATPAAIKKFIIP